MGESESLESFQLLLLAGIAGMILLAVALVVFFVFYQRQLLRQQELRRREERAHERELLKAIVSSQDHERNRIARDLHDDLGSLLTAARLYLRQLRPDAPETTHNERVKQESLGILDRAIASTRRIAYDLYPPELRKFGFFTTVEDLLRSTEAAGGPGIYLDIQDAQRLDPAIEVALYRVVQELVNNTLKYADANEIIFRARRQPDGWVFNYLDDGKGFTVQKLSPGLGLRNIESRVKLINGTLEVESSPGSGLSVRIEVPSTP